jgi:murein L,D-transpeptidase YafK
MRRMTTAALLIAALATSIWLALRARQREAALHALAPPPPGAPAPPAVPAARVAAEEAARLSEDVPMVADAPHVREVVAEETSMPEMPDVLVDPRLVVTKSARTLELVSGGGVVKTYRIALGTSPVGDKSREGDRRTPEGSFYVCTKNPKSRHERSLGISYPSLEHAEAGLEEGLITKRQFRTITEALRHYERPPWNTPLGGEIMIHGGGTESDWTQGCIALDDEDALELYDRLPMGTRVDVLP